MHTDLVVYVLLLGIIRLGVVILLAFIIYFTWLEVGVMSVSFSW